MAMMHCLWCGHNHNITPQQATRLVTMAQNGDLHIVTYDGTRQGKTFPSMPRTQIMSRCLLEALVSGIEPKLSRPKRDRKERT